MSRIRAGGCKEKQSKSKIANPTTQINSFSGSLRSKPGEYFFLSLTAILAEMAFLPIFAPCISKLQHNRNERRSKSD